MKKRLLTGIDRLSRLAMLVIFVTFGLKASALESDDINAAILDEGRFSIPVQWINDPVNPWYLYEREDGTSFLHSPDKETSAGLISTISFNYTSEYPTQFSFRRFVGYESSSTDGLQISIDGEVATTIRSESWNYDYTSPLIPEGTHNVELKYTQMNSYTLANRSTYYAGIDNFKVQECQELENACLTPESLPLTFENDPDHMWITEDGYISSQGSSTEGYTTSISTTFTIDKPSLFGYEMTRTGTSTSSSLTYGVSCIIDGESYWKNTDTDWAKKGIVLYPGTHTIEFKAYKEQVRIRNVRLDQTWYDINVTTPGALGGGMLQALGDKYLQDTELLKIRGSINADDWALIDQLTQIRAVDFSETNITEIPAYAFSGRRTLSTVILPNTLEEIGESAFYQTGFYQVTIPASVKTIGASAWKEAYLDHLIFEDNSQLTSIGNEAFYGTWFQSISIPASVKSIGNGAWHNSSLRQINFAEDCHLTTIGYRAFRNSKLEEFIMPNSVTNLSYYSNNYYDTSSPNWEYGQFEQCYYLKKLILSENLTYLPNYMANGCTALEEIKIPENVKKIGQECFYRCTNLKIVELNSHCNNMLYPFAGCTSIDKIILPCATPPTNYYSSYYDRTCDPFSNGPNKDTVELIVPDFALEAYKLDSYWYNFKNAHAGDEASIKDYWAINGKLNLNSTHTMRETPSVEMMTGSTLTIDPETVQSFNEFTYNTSQASPANYLSKSHGVTAVRLITSFYVDKANTWYFFSPVVDVNMSEVSYPATDSWVIRYYDGARRASEDTSSGNWVNVPANGVLHRGQGYIFQANAVGTLYLPAAAVEEHDKFFGANEETLTLEDNLCETAANAGWNFISNPYPTYYDIYYMDMQAPITVWTGSTYRALSLNDGDRGTDTYVLRPMQPFFVQKGTTELTARMPLVGRQITTDIDRTRAPRRIVSEENSMRQLLNLELFAGEKEEADDYSRIVLNEKASLDYETMCDASKFMSMNQEVAQLYSLGADNHPMAINERPYDSGNVTLGVYIPESGKVYRIAATRCDRQAWLYDAQTGMQHDLTAGEYLFTAGKAGVDNTRFSIRFGAGSVGAEALSAAGVKVQGLAGAIAVSVPADTEVEVYSADGSVIANGTQIAGTTSYQAGTGVYVVKVNGSTYKVIVK